MRTTLTLDDDVARLLEKEVRRSGNSFKATINRGLRLGLMASARPQTKAFRVTPRELGVPAGLRYDNAEELIEALEGPARK